METSAPISTQSKTQSKRPYRSPQLQDYGTVQGLTASGGFGAKNEAGFGAFYANSA